jgi:probable addiction module antidote protein
MPKKKIKYSNEYKAIESYTVLMEKDRPSKSYSRDDILLGLANPEIYPDFLKLCLEADESKDLKAFRLGLLFVVKAIGLSGIAKKVGLPRVTVYRMLSKSGNPSLKNLCRLLNALSLRLWVVDEEFIKRGNKIKRYKYEVPDELPEKKGWQQFY